MDGPPRARGCHSLSSAGGFREQIKNSLGKGNPDVTAESPLGSPADTVFWGCRHLPAPDVLPQPQD